MSYSAAQRQEISKMFNGSNELDHLEAILNQKNERPAIQQKAALKTVSASALFSMDLPPVQFVVDSILPVGTTVLSAAPKIGKSWLALDLGLCVASGRPFLGYPTNRAEVLYLALEDSLNRLKERMGKILCETPPPDGFYLTTEAPVLDEKGNGGLIDVLTEQLKATPKIKLVIIDTLQKVRGQVRSKTESAYTTDYKEVGALKKFADDHGIALLLVHHNRKMRDADDPLAMISGTMGISGAVDTAWVLLKQKRADSAAELHITGRDTPMLDLSVRFNPDDYRWKNLGDTANLKETQEREEYRKNPVALTIKKLVETSPGNVWTGSGKQLLDAVGVYHPEYSFLDTPREFANKQLAPLIGKLQVYDGIKHTTIGNGTGGKKHRFEYSVSVEFEEITDDDTENPFL